MHLGVHHLCVYSDLYLTPVRVYYLKSKTKLHISNYKKRLLKDKMKGSAGEERQQCVLKSNETSTITTLLSGLGLSK